MLNSDFLYTCVWMYTYLSIYTSILVSIFLIVVSTDFLLLGKNVRLWQWITIFVNAKTYYKIIYILQLLLLAGVPPLSLFWIKIFVLQKFLKINSSIYFIFYILYFIFLLYFYFKYIKITIPLSKKNVKYTFICNVSMRHEFNFLYNLYNLYNVYSVIIFLTLMPMCYNEIFIVFRYIFTL